MGEANLCYIQQIDAWASIVSKTRSAWICRSLPRFEYVKGQVHVAMVGKQYCQGFANSPRLKLEELGSKALGFLQVLPLMRPSLLLPALLWLSQIPLPSPEEACDFVHGLHSVHNFWVLSRDYFWEYGNVFYTKNWNTHDQLNIRWC